MNQTLTKSKPAFISNSESGLNISPAFAGDVKAAVLSFIDTALVNTGQGTFYNKKSDQLIALHAVHDAVFKVNRGLYASMLCLPGVLDLSKQIGFTKMLEDGQTGVEESLLTREQENIIIAMLSRNIRPSALMRQFEQIAKKKINNSRTKRFILGTILSSNNLPLWVVKYRPKIRSALTHVWGRKMSSAIKYILMKNVASRTDKENSILRSYIDKYASKANTSLTPSDMYQCICFVLGGRIGSRYTVPILAQRIDAREDLSKGKDLPIEILDGIRTRYHKGTSKAKALDVAKGSMTETQKRRVQNQAKEAGVEIKMDATRQDIVSLYVYSYAMGMTREIRKAIDAKARSIGFSFPLKYKNVGIVLDSSKSMFGTEQQKCRPISVALSMRDVLQSVADKYITVTTAGDPDDYGMINPRGDTSIAEALLRLIDRDMEFDAIYLITDGYENAPAGRTAEVIEKLKEIGYNTPLFQVSPVMSAETATVKALSPHVATMPVLNPEGIALAVFKAAITSDISSGIQTMLDSTRRILEDKQ